MVQIYYNKTDNFFEVDECAKLFQYYGIESSYLNIDENDIVQLILNNHPEMVIIFENVLLTIDVENILFKINEIPDYSPSILLYNLSIKSNEIHLRSLFKFEIVGSTNNHSIESIVFNIREDVTDSLSGVRVPIKEFIFHNLNFFKIQSKKTWKVIANVNKNNIDYPIIIDNTIKKTSIYANIRLSYHTDISTSNIMFQYKKLIIEKIVLLILLKKVFGDRIWHYPQIHANFTIDDPRLTKTYGFLDFVQLLREMRKNTFHTTIAFIPWNFKRNEKKTIQLFRQNPEFYSICYHGNNHDRREFYRYSNTSRNKYPPKSIALQEKNILQSLMRIKKMKEMVGLSVDKVMVFPHGIAPSKTLNILKKHHYLFTVNKDNVPLDEPWPEDFRFYLDVVTVCYSDFPNIRRFRSIEFLDSNTNWIFEFLIFLKNHVITHTHHDFFASGINRFNSIAEKFNRFNVVWGNLGKLSKMLYKIQRVDIKNFNVNVISDSIILRNDNLIKSFYFVKRRNDPLIKTVFCNNRRIDFIVTNGLIEFQITLEPSESAIIDFRSEVITDDIREDVKYKKSLRVFIIRILCEIRDTRFITKMLLRLKN